MDLSIGVFISALSQARKDEDCIFTKEMIHQFLEVWADYDPKATGWIDADQLLFLIFELPQPLGAGKLSPSYEGEFDYDKYYAKCMEENMFIVKASHIHKSLSKNIQIKRVSLHGENYLVHEEKGLVIKETRSAKILNAYEIPLYTDNTVHFKDVIRQQIKYVFAIQGYNFEPNPKVEAKFDRKWKRRFAGVTKHKQIKLKMVDLFLAGRMLLHALYKIRDKRRALKYDDKISDSDRNYSTIRGDTGRIEVPQTVQPHPLMKILRASRKRYRANKEVRFDRSSEYSIASENKSKASNTNNYPAPSILKSTTGAFTNDPQP